MLYLKWGEIVERQEIIENLENYISLENTDYAIMIDGEWGIGKTFFVKNDLKALIEKFNLEIEKKNIEEEKKEEENKKTKKKKKHKEHKEDEENKKEKKYKIVYASLFGISSELEVDEVIFNSLGTNITSNVTKNLPKNAKKWVKERLKKKSEKDKSKDEPEKDNTQEQMSNWFVNDKVIFIFDDFDRIKMDVVTLLGHLNKYVEHNKSKVIFVANEKELQKLNLSVNKEQKLLVAMNTPEYLDFSKNYNTSSSVDEMSKVLNSSLTNLFVNEDLYNTTKEKVIGKTFKLEMDFNDVIEEIIGPLLNTKAELKIVDKESVEYINEIANKENHYNIRTMKRILENCSDYFKKIEKLSKQDENFADIEYNEQYKNEVFKHFVVCTIMYNKNIAKYDKVVCSATYKEIKEEKSNDVYRVFESVKEMVKSGSFNQGLVKEEYNMYLEYNKFFGNLDQN